MKADTSQIPEAEVKTDGLTTKPTKAKDAQWSMIRRLTDRVVSLELAASTARRDLNRIEKRQYRGKDNPPPSNEDPPPTNGGSGSTEAKDPAMWG